MKSILLSSIMLLFATMGWSQNEHRNNTDDSKIALQGYSPVSYLDLGIAQIGLKEYKSTYNGLAYYFTGQEQKNSFDADPKKYLPQYGGYCAFGVSVGAKFRVDPNKFIVKNGKYYLFLYDLEVDAQQLWLAGNHAQLASKANTNWVKMLSK